MATLIWHPQCTACQKAREWLEAQGIEPVLRDIRTDGPDEAELLQWQCASGVPLHRFVYAGSLLYKGMNLQEKLTRMSDDALLALMVQYPLLLRRPVLLDGGRVLIGFREAEWAASLLPHRL